MVYTRRPSDQRCEEIYAYITEYVAENGHSPTFREVGNAVGLRSSSTVSRYIHRLVDEGRITIDESKPRRCMERIRLRGLTAASWRFMYRAAQPMPCSSSRTVIPCCAVRRSQHPSI